MTTKPAGAMSLFREKEGAVPNSLVLVWTTFGWAGSFALMGAASVWLNVLGVLLCVQTMVLAAYLVHEAAHYTLFATSAANRRVGEWVGFIAGAGYAPAGLVSCAQTVNDKAAGAGCHRTQVDGGTCGVTKHHIAAPGIGAGTGRVARRRSHNQVGQAVAIDIARP